MADGTIELFRDEAFRQATRARVVAVRPDGIVLDQTVFYPMAGGQPGDRGTLRATDGRGIAIDDTRYAEDGALLHMTQGAVPFAVGEAVEAVLDWPRRYRLMRVHSCLHLLCRAVDEAVTGGQIGEDRGRLDFAIPGDVPTKEAVTAKLNAWIAADLPIRHRWVDAAELDRQPELVRTMSVRPPRTGGRVRLVEIEGVDLQACGGTHVARTAEIGPVAVVKIENKGKQNRRFTVALREDQPPS
ncbi:MAG: alanyl-tRNA editing protein [Geminicoccaceae bacterium]|nr:MAG: alanyl-tRNA editing protein [Geminicoccaceae bacterium]